VAVGRLDGTLALHGLDGAERAPCPPPRGHGSDDVCFSADGAHRR
jgi:hypothetical protein